MRESTKEFLYLYWSFAFGKENGESESDGKWSCLGHSKIICLAFDSESIFLQIMMLSIGECFVLDKSLWGGVGVKRRKPYWLIQHSSLRTAEDDLAWVKLYSRQAPEKGSRDVKFYNQQGNANVLTGEDLILDSFQYCGQSFQDLYWGLAISQWNTFSALLLL